MKIALTGGIACGKSKAAAIMVLHGVEVCEADQLAHEALDVGSAVYARIVDHFGDDILDAAGAIDRRRLGARVFESDADRAVLNGLVHPVVAKAWTNWLEHRAPGTIAMVVVPLLYEAGFGSGWDAVICVSASLSRRLRRLEARGLSEQEARRRMAAQWPEIEKMMRADYVIWNDGDEACLEAQIERILDNMQRGQ